MIDVMIPGEGGKIHAVYHRAADPTAPLAVVLSGNPRNGFHMNDRVSYALFRAFMDIGFSVVRFNYRGVEESEGNMGTMSDNMIDIATIIDWIQNKNEDSGRTWIAGHEQGAWYTLHTMMRRPEISGFVLVSPDTNIPDATFLSPRPNRGAMIQGALAGEDAKLFATHITQLLKRSAQIDLETIRIKGADAAFTGTLRNMYDEVKAYVGREDADMKLL